MEHVNIAEIITWPQAIVAVVLLVWPGVAAWVQAKRSAVTVDKVHKSMTTNNGGSHVKDALDRIEGRQEEQSQTLTDLTERLSALEKWRRRRW